MNPLSLLSPMSSMFAGPLGKGFDGGQGLGLLGGLLPMLLATQRNNPSAAPANAPGNAPSTPNFRSPMGGGFGALNGMAGLPPGGLIEALGLLGKRPAGATGAPLSLAPPSIPSLPLASEDYSGPNALTGMW